LSIIGTVADSFVIPRRGLALLFERPPGLALPWFMTVRVVRPDTTVLEVGATGDLVRRTDGEHVVVVLDGLSTQDVPPGSIVHFLGAAPEREWVPPPADA
jgi:hypothetical protein